MPTTDLEMRYEMLEALPGAGVRSWKARQRSTGREVTVHRLGRGASEAAELAEMRRLAHTGRKILESGEEQEGVYVITAAPPWLDWREWVRVQRAGPTAEDKFGRAGAWKLPPGAAGHHRERAPEPAPQSAPAAPVEEVRDVEPDRSIAATKFFSSRPPSPQPPPAKLELNLGATGAMAAPPRTSGRRVRWRRRRRRLLRISGRRARWRRRR